jgi:peptide deformylase
MMRLLLNDEPALSRVSAPVKQGEDIEELLAYMWAVFDAKPKGIGLAANQVNVCKRVFIIKTAGLTQEFINPVIIKASKQMTNSEEECLSCPRITVTVVRHKQITLTGFDKNWNPLKLKLRGIDSMVAQHEMYHLNGITLKHLQENNSVGA